MNSLNPGSTVTQVSRLLARASVVKPNSTPRALLAHWNLAPLRRSWAQRSPRIDEVDPLTCTQCGSEMRIVAFLLDPSVVRKILHDLVKRRDRARASPAAAAVATAALR